MTRKITMLLFAVLLIFSFAGTVLAEGGGDCADAPSVEPVGEMPVMDIDVDTGVIEADPDVEQVLPEVYETPELDYAEQPMGEDVTAQSLDSDLVFEEKGSDSESDLELGDDTAPVEEAEAATLPQASYGDPYFYYGGNTYSFYFGGDSANNDEFNYYDLGADAIQEAINHIHSEGTTPSDGLIYVESYTSPYKGFSINGTLLYLDTLRGVVWSEGWQGEIGDKPEIVGDINIVNMPSGFTLYGFIITGQVFIGNCNGQINLTDLEVKNSSGSGIRMPNQNGNVVFDNVVATGHEYYGAIIDNVSGGNVTVKDSEFNGNAKTDLGTVGYSGLHVTTSGNVILENVTASDNGAGVSKGNGAWINSLGDRVSVVVRGNYNEFSNNGTYGLNIVAAGNVSIRNVIADNNSKQVYGFRGIEVINSSAASGTVTISSSAGFLSSASNNNGVGLRIGTNGNVSISDFICDGNSGAGAGIFVYSSGRTLTITNSQFNRNFGGLKIETGGIVTINGISASYNSGGHGLEAKDYSRLTVTNGVFSGNSGCGLSAESAKLAPVTLSSIYAYGNGSDGVRLQGRGNYLLTDVNAIGNSGYGIHANNSTYKDENNDLQTNGTGNITIRSSRAGVCINVSQNDSIGMYIRSKGVISISDVTANNNSSYGLDIDNSTAPSPRNLTLTRVNLTNNGDDGASLRSKGNVLLVDVNSNDNGASGIYIFNRLGSGSVTIRASRAGTAYDFSENLGNGLRILSNGVVSISDVNISGNGRRGVEIDNSTASAARAVTVIRGVFNGNIEHGANIESKGAVTLVDVSANNNGTTDQDHHGLWINNLAGVGNVTIRSSKASIFNEFNGNAKTGVLIQTAGTVNLTNIQATGNKRGAYISGDDLQIYPRAVTIRQGTFSNNNDGDGLNIVTHGTITLENVSATNNNSYGAYLHNGWTTGRADIIIRGSYNEFSDNGNIGLYIDAKNNVSLLNIICEDNNIGAYIYARGNVTVNSSRNFTNSISNNDKAGLVVYIDANGTVALTNLASNENGDEGINVNTRGNVILTNVSASGNGEHSNKDGVTINNSSGSGNVTVRSSGVASYVEYSGNGRAGLYIDSRGTVVVSNVIASDNGNQGVYINYPYETSPAARPVSVTRVFLNNNNDGLVITATGTVTLDTVVACDNTADGVTISNYNENATANVIIRGSGNDISRNGQGLYIRTSGQITIANLNASDNTQTGADLGRNGHSAVNVTITNGVFNNNGDDNTSYHGLRIDTYGNATLTNVEASGNGGRGIDVSNSKNLVMRNTLRNQALNISGNGSDGIQTEYLTGNVSISGNIIFSDNKGNGATLDLYDTNGNVTLSGLTFDGNILRNLFVSTGGSVTLTNIRADNSDGDGVQIQSFNGGSGTVRLTGRNSFSGNTGSGLSILTDGHVNVRGVTAENNGNRGIDVSEKYDDKLKTVFLQDVTVTGNKSEGIYIGKSDSTITFNNVKSFLNTNVDLGDPYGGASYAGIYVNEGTGTVSFINSAIIGNYYYGIHVCRGPELVTFRNTYYLGNNLSNETGYVNVYYQH